jgi:hypothetical protein
VLDAWQPGARVFDLGDLWLLGWPSTRRVDAVRSGGLPVRRTGTTWTISWAGRLDAVEETRLPVLDITTWVDLSAVPVTRLIGLETPAVVATDAPAAPPTPTLADRAGVGTDRERDDIATAAREFARRAADAAGAAGARGSAGATDAAQGATGKGVAKVPQPVGVAGSRWAEWLVRRGITLGFERRYAAYLEQLREAFEAGDYDRALRRAISIGGEGGRLTLRLPSPISGPLTPGSRRRGSGADLPGGVPVDEFLRDLYLKAVRRLTAAGRVVEAAYVHADLLNDPATAMDLLEDADQFAVAAELGERRDLPAAAIRLWLRAGRPERAVAVARRSGAWAQALALAIRRAGGRADDPLVRQLRTAWVGDLLDVGDLPAAVDAAWPEPSLRGSVVPAIGRALATGGPTATRLLANLLQLENISHQGEVGRAAEAAERMLTDLSGYPTSAQWSLILGLRTLRPADPATDRRLCDAAVRLLLTKPLADHDGVRGALKELTARADPVLAADVAGLHAKPTTIGGWVADMPDPGGQLPIRDAVAVPGGVLVAFGDVGLRLLTDDGRVKASWDVRAEQIVVADHGLVALVVSARRDDLLVHRLDLSTRRLRTVGAVPAWGIVDTFDGRIAVLLGDGLRFVDTTDPSGPRLVWRDLPDRTILAVQRAADRMVALHSGRAITEQGPTGPQVWQWRLPDLRLLSRTSVKLDPDAPTPALDLDGRLHPVGDGQWMRCLRRGTVIGWLDPSRCRLTLTVGRRHGTLTWPRPQPQPAVREHGTLVTFHTSDGRVVVVDTARWVTASSFTTAVG